jgi:tRNA modification GTPase
MHRSSEGSALERSKELTSPDREPVAGETIAAISTPTGEGAIALVRLSGPDAIAVAGRIFRGKEKPPDFVPNVQHFGEIIESGRLIDQVMISVHRAPTS